VILHLTLDQVLCLRFQVEDVCLAVVDVVVNQVQAFGGMQIFHETHLLPEKFWILSWIRGCIHHQLVKALAPGFRNFVRAELSFALLLLLRFNFIA
jgi:hypothetical protein